MDRRPVIAISPEAAVLDGGREAGFLARYDAPGGVLPGESVNQ